MKKTQIGWVVILIAIVVELLSIYQHSSKLSLIILSVGMAAMLILFGTLTIKVTDEHFIFYFGIGLIRGKYKLRDIVYCRPIQYFSLGWGIRFKPGVTIYNVSGNKAIEIKLRNKYNTIYVGTDIPEEVTGWIYEKMKVNANNLTVE